MGTWASREGSPLSTHTWTPIIGSFEDIGFCLAAFGVPFFNFGKSAWDKKIWELLSFQSSPMRVPFQHPW